MARKRNAQDAGQDAGSAEPTVIGEPTVVSIESKSITRLDDGTVCIGDGCSVMRIPKTGNVQLDISKCPDDVKALIAKRIGVDGAATEYKSH
jgi:hypothetical protein